MAISQLSPITASIRPSSCLAVCSSRNIRKLKTIVQKPPMQVRHSKAGLCRTCGDAHSNTRLIRAKIIPSWKHTCTARILREVRITSSNDNR